MINPREKENINTKSVVVYILKFAELLKKLIILYVTPHMKAEVIYDSIKVLKSCLKRSGQYAIKVIIKSTAGFINGEKKSKSVLKKYRHEYAAPNKEAKMIFNIFTELFGDTRCKIKKSVIKFIKKNTSM